MDCIYLASDGSVGKALSRDNGFTSSHTSRARAGTTLNILSVPCGAQCILLDRSTWLLTI